MEVLAAVLRGSNIEAAAEVVPAGATAGVAVSVVYREREGEKEKGERKR